MDAVRFSRRALLFGREAGSRSERVPLLPSWADSASFSVRCDGCNACVERCPPKVLVLHAGHAEFDPSLGECTFCGDCVDACTTGALRRDQPAERHLAVVDDACLPAHGVVCASCREICPANAIRVPPGGRGIASIDNDACTGCGACVAVCPTQAIALHLKEIAHA